MARSAHAYVRGSTVSFTNGWTAVAAANSRIVPFWICGDCHVGNVGPVADAKGRVLIQIRDLDQTVIGDPAHDLIRLGLSLASASRGSDLPGVTTAKMLEELFARLPIGVISRYETDQGQVLRPKAIQTLLAQSTRRRWRSLAEERLDSVKPTIPLGKRFWALISVIRCPVNASRPSHG